MSTITTNQTDAIQPTPTEHSDSKLIDYELLRQPLWDIHEFLAQVLAHAHPGFAIRTSKHGTRSIEAMALGRRYYRLLNNLIARIPMPSKAPGLVGLFIDCCVELQLFYNPFGKPGDYHRPGMNGAELFNALLDLIRKRAKKDQRCRKLLHIAEDYDLQQIKSIITYINALFRLYSKLLVVRVDLGYLAEEADRITFEKANDDITRFVNRHHWYPEFRNWVGFVIGREYGAGSESENGERGRGYHFHCFIFFNGQKEKNDKRLADAMIDYWNNRIVNRRNTREDERIKTWTHNCHMRDDQYAYSGIGRIAHSDEVKRTNLLYALLYLTKNSQELGDAAPPKSKTISMGQIPERTLERRGRRRHLMIGRHVVEVPSVPTKTAPLGGYPNERT